MAVEGNLGALCAWLSRFDGPQAAADELGLVIQESSLDEAGPVLLVGRLITVQSGTSEEVRARSWIGIAYHGADALGIFDVQTIELAACAAWQATGGPASGSGTQFAVTAG